MTARHRPLHDEAVRAGAAIASEVRGENVRGDYRQKSWSVQLAAGPECLPGIHLDAEASTTRVVDVNGDFSGLPPRQRVEQPGSSAGMPAPTST